MAKFRVLQDFILNGKEQKAETIISLDHQQSQLKSIQAFIEKVPDNTPLEGEKPSELNSIKPGQELTAEQKEKLAKENAAESAEAYRLAEEQRARDLEGGREAPAVQVIADHLKEKLTNEEFQTIPVDTVNTTTEEVQTPTE